MKKIIILPIFSILLYACTPVGDPKLDQFMFIVQNNCTYPVQVAYLWYPERIRNYCPLPQNTTVEDGRGSRRYYVETYEENEKNFLAQKEVRISILYPRGYEEIFTLQEFVAKAEAQMGEKGRGDWVLTLCLDNEN